MSAQLRLIHPDGRQELRALRGETASLDELEAAVGGWVEYVSPTYHALSTHEAVINEEGAINGMAPNWAGSRLIGLDLTRYAPLHGPIAVIPHDPEDGPTPAQRRAGTADSLAATFARALEGDPVALRLLGVQRPEDITVIDATQDVTQHLYAVHPDGRVERCPATGDPADWHAWIDARLGPAVRLPGAAFVLTAYALLYSERPHDPRPNRPAGQAVGLHPTRQLRGPVVLVPTGAADPSTTHQCLDEALHGDPAAGADLGLRADWLPQP